MTLKSIVTSDKSIADHKEKQNGKDTIQFYEALEKTGFGMFNYLLILLCGVVIASTFYETATISYILPIAECDLKMTNQNKGILSAIGYIGIIVSSHLWGFLADTKGRRAVMMPTLLLSSAISILSSFSTSFWMLFVLRFINGFFISGSSATIYAYIGEFHIDRNRSRALMAGSVIFSILLILLPILAWSVLNLNNWSLPLDFLGIVYKPWRQFIMTCACPGILAGIMLFLYPESPKYLLSVGKDEEAIQVLKKMYNRNVGIGELKIGSIIPENDTIVQNLKDSSAESSNLVTAFLNTMWKQTVPLFQKNLLLSTVLTCTIQFWMLVTVYGISMWYPIMVDAMVEFRNHNPLNTSSVCDVIYAKQFEFEHKMEDGSKKCSEKMDDKTFMFSLALESFYCVGFFVIGFLVKKFQKTHILFVILFAFGTCGLMTNFIFDTMLALIVFNMFFLSGVGVQVLSGITVELYPTHLRAMALCISLMVGRIGGVAGANITGLLLANNCEMTFYIAGTGLIASAILTLLIPKPNSYKDDRSVVS